MTDINFGESISWWLGIVVNVYDPHESGRVQIRVFGRHDDTVNIPDDSLPWALVMQPVTSAGIGKVGSSPVGLVKNSRVVGLWLDNDHQYPLVMGTVGKSGDPIPGETENGAPKIDTTTGSIPSASQASAPHPYNPYSSLYNQRVSIKDIDSGIADIFSVLNTTGSVTTKDVEKLLNIPKVPTIGYAAKGGSSSALHLARQVDPYNQISALPCMPELMTKFLDISSLVTKALTNVIREAVKAAVTAFLKLAKQIGIFKLLKMLNEIARELSSVKKLIDTIAKNLCGIKGLTDDFSAADRVLANTIYTLNSITGYNHGVTKSIPPSIANAAFSLIPNPTPISVATSTSAIPSVIVTSPPPNYVPLYVDASQDPYPGYLGYYDPINPSNTVVYTERNNQPNYTSPQEHIRGVAEISLSTAIVGPIVGGSLTSDSLYKGINGSVQTAAITATAVSIGIGLLQNPDDMESIADAVIADVSSATQTVKKTVIVHDNLASSTTASPLVIIRKIAKIGKLLGSASHIGEQTKLAIKRQMFKASLGPSIV